MKVFKKQKASKLKKGKGQHSLVVKEEQTKAE